MTSQQDKPLPLHQRHVVTATQAARLLGMSRSTFYSLDRDGLIPAGVQFASLGRRWRVDELRAWEAAGFPDRDSWRWRPTMIPTLEQYIQQQHMQLDSLKEERQAVERELHRRRHQLEKLERIEQLERSNT